MSDKLTIAFLPEAAYGASLNCVALAQELRDMGHRPVFLCDPGFAGMFGNYGFHELPVAMSPLKSDAEIADFWQRFIDQHRPHFHLSPLDQIATYEVPAWNAIVDSAIHAEPGLKKALATLKPDVVCLDNVVYFPAIGRAGCPWVRIISCAETELPDEDVPPYTSGCSLEDRASWNVFRSAYVHALKPVHDRYNAFLTSVGEARMVQGEFLQASPWLNLLLTPEAIGYRRRQPLDPRRFAYIGGAVRAEAPYELPYFPKHNDKPLIYIGFGSLGAADTDLFQRLINLFAETPYRVLMSVGPYKDHYETVPDNIHLEYWYPQPSVIPQVDLFIHHGGNNSLNEALTFGKPSLVMPYCWDGHDNAQRVEELKLGARLPRYDWRPQEMLATVRRLLSDTAMKRQLKELSASLAAQNQRRRAAELIVRAAHEGSRRPSRSAPVG
ncbi:glycosyltransferase [Dongia deserti]|uniref:glycosyltransferase n=1 Tax=Dongia deserti TaxID=2268030 RepID=UPI000E657470|nr:glycosyltransferase [Dongia deserti]